MMNYAQYGASLDGGQAHIHNSGRAHVTSLDAGRDHMVVAARSALHPGRFIALANAPPRAIYSPGAPPTNYPTFFQT